MNNGLEHERRRRKTKKTQSVVAKRLSGPSPARHMNKKDAADRNCN